MSTSYPASLDAFENPTVSDYLDTVNHVNQHSDNNDATEAIQAKVGVDSSAVTTSHDYKLSGVTGTDKAVSKTGTETLSGKTLTTPTLTTPKVDTIAEATANAGVTIDGLKLQDAGLVIGSDADGDVYYRASGALARLAKGAAAQVLTMNAGATAPSWAVAAGGSTTAVARAYCNAGMSNLTNVTWTKVVLDTENYDPGADFDSTTNYRYTASANGYYQVSGAVYFINAVVNTRYVIAIYKNGTAYCYVALSNSAGTTEISGFVTDLIPLAATNYVELWVLSVSGDNTVDISSGTSYTFMSVGLITTY